MTPGSDPDARRFDTLGRLFDELVGLDAAAREAAIQERCGDDPAMASEIRALLGADVSGEPDRFIAGVVAGEGAPFTTPDASGRTLGSWRIVRPLAEGGMGTVYLAERSDGAYDALAAIKLVRGGIPSAQLDARLKVERQILAGLSHPGIAKLLDGGNTEDGTPFLVLEFIDGEPITTWCAAHALDVDARLRLFLRVCESVGYAHSQLVAHRDLKPSNILVTADGEPKLLDFGIAKLVDAVDESAEGQTRSAPLMTPAYASPEQVSGRRAGVATDVYALGVLLYEMLTGRLPLETRGLTPAGLQKVVLADVPALPSSVTEARLAKRLAGDLDAVVSRALRKEPEQRYASVLALADDVRRHLDGLPVQVRHDDWAYRTGKLVRRNAGVVSAGLLLLIVLASFTASTLLQARALAQERDRAETQRETAVRVSGFLEELLSEADPNEASGREVTAREVLDRGAARVLEGLAADPVIQSALATVMGRVYRNLGEYDAALPLLDSGLVARRRARPSDPLSLGESLVERGALAYDLGNYDEALGLQHEALEAYRAGGQGDEQATADAIDWKASTLSAMGRMDEAEAAAREGVAMNRRLHPDGDRDEDAALAVSMISLADILRGRGAYDEARALGEEGLALQRAAHGDMHLEVAWALNQLASTLNRSGHPDEAIPYVQESLRVRRQVLDGPHAETAASLGNLAGILASVGRLEEAEAPRRESVQMMRDVFGDVHPYTAASVNSLGELLMQTGRTEEGVATLEEALRLHRLAYTEGHPNIAYPLTALGRAMLTLDRPRDAEAYLSEAYALRKNGLPEGHWFIAASGLDLGRALDRLGRPDEAEGYLQEAYTLLTSALGADDARTGQARTALREHYLARGMDGRAAELGEGG